MKLTHVIAKNLNENKVNTVFGVQGGAVVHIFDSIHEVTDINVCYNHHEQGSALAAVANAKINKTLGVCVVTTGPATTNAITGLLSAWQDSVPVLFISGQTRKEQTSYGKEVRQRGSQECNIIDVVKPWTKAQFLITEESDVDQLMKDAIHIAINGRKGPVWIDVPVNLQWTERKFKEIPTYQSNNTTAKTLNKELFNLKTKDLVKEINSAEKPVFVLGRNFIPQKVLNKFFKFAADNSIPILTTWGTAGIVGKKANNIGIVGMSGQQAANLALRISDLAIFINCHFSATQAGNNYTTISQSQKFCYINIDLNELNNLFIKNNSSFINIDSSTFLQTIVKKNLTGDYTKWNDFCSEISDNLSPLNCSQRLDIKNYANPHKFIAKLYSKLNSDDTVIIDGGGCALYAGFQCIPTEASFEIICSTAISAMGTGLPELVGASAKSSKKRFYCIIGDGSLMFNLQELQTLITNCKPAIIIVLNNGGYLAIRHTQGQFLGKRFYGTSNYSNGIEIPSIQKIANAFNFDYLSIKNNSEIDLTIEKCLKYNKHTILEIFASPSHENLFTASFKDNKDGTFSPNDIHLMKPFEDYKFEEIASKFKINLTK